jgi:hypothetical protein
MTQSSSTKHKDGKRLCKMKITKNKNNLIDRHFPTESGSVWCHEKEIAIMIPKEGTVCFGIQFWNVSLAGRTIFSVPTYPTLTYRMTEFVTL